MNIKIYCHQHRLTLTQEPGLRALREKDQEDSLVHHRLHLCQQSKAALALVPQRLETTSYFENLRINSAGPWSRTTESDSDEVNPKAGYPHI